MYIVTVGVLVKHQKQIDSVDLDVIAHYAKVKYIFSICLKGLSLYFGFIVSLQLQIFWVMLK